jgi:hypothetical protein
MKIRHALWSAALLSGHAPLSGAQALLAPATPATEPATYGMRISIDPVDGRIVPTPPLRFGEEPMLRLPLLAAPAIRTDSRGTTFLSLDAPMHHAIGHLEPDGSVRVGCTDASHGHQP